MRIHILSTSHLRCIFVFVFDLDFVDMRELIFCHFFLLFTICPFERMVDFFLKCDKIKKIINFIFFFPALKGQYTQLLVQYEELKAGVSIVQEKNTPLYFCKLARLLSYQQLQAFLLT